MNKISADDIRQMIELHSSGLTQRQIADNYGVNPSVVSRHLKKTEEDLIKYENTYHKCWGTKLYNVFLAMSQRCYNENNKRFSRYGGRGIYICAEWKGKFVEFQKWSEVNGYKEGLQIDRIDNNGPYSPKNCRWATLTTNNRNRNCVRLNMDKAREIRKMSKNGTHETLIAKIYKVERTAIRRCIQNKTWREYGDT